MNEFNSYNYLGYSHAKYLENDPIQYDIKVNEVVFKENQGTHFHDDVELLFLVNGEAKLYVNNELNIISTGNLVMLMPYHVHAIKLISNSLTVYQGKVSLGLLLYSSISRLIEKHISYSLAYGNVVARLTDNEKKKIQQNFEEIIEELNSDTLLSTMIGLNIITKIILMFSRNIAASISADECYDHSITWKLMQYMNMNFSNDISAKSMATEFSMSPNKINNYFYL